MDKEKVLLILNEIVTFYLDAHEDSKDIPPTHEEIERAEKYIGDNLKSV